MKNKYKILRKEFKKVLENAIVSADDNGKEICGLIVDNGYFLNLITLKNKIKKGGGFSFYYNEVRFIQKAINKMDLEIIGTFHSHPIGLPEPSKSDIYGALDDSFMLIIDVLGKNASLWYLKKYKKKKMQIEFI